MLDVHSHILPKVDDGVSDFGESLEIVEALEGLGFDRMVLTPHLYGKSRDDDLDPLRRSFDAFLSEIKKSGLRMQFTLGSEIMLDPSFLSEKPSPPLIFINNNVTYQLIEFSPFIHPLAIESYAAYAKTYAIKPIVAHVERLQNFFASSKLAQTLRTRGFLFQVDIQSLADETDKSYGGSAKKLFKDNMIDILATDCHSQRNLRKIAEGIEYIRGKTAGWKKYFELP